MKTIFQTTLLAFGNNTGIEVPASNIAELGDSKKPPVTVDVNGYIYKSTVAVMAGRSMISFSKAHREASGISAGDKLTVTLELDEGPREVVVPAELQRALDSADLLDVFGALSYSRRKEFARQIADAKTEETRQRRIDKIARELKQDGR
jgi:bifunctional DNA-binding transcriptional regulator/antitoxin component of YhaV-PrlF toxin-antitoxin module